MKGRRAAHERSMNQCSKLDHPLLRHSAPKRSGRVIHTWLIYELRRDYSNAVTTPTAMIAIPAVFVMAFTVASIQPVDFSANWSRVPRSQFTILEESWKHDDATSSQAKAADERATKRAHAFRERTTGPSGGGS